MTATPRLTRRHFVLAAGAGALLALPAVAAPFRQITWGDLIPPGLPCTEVIAMIEADEQNVAWNPVFDEYATQLNGALDEAPVRVPANKALLDIGADGVTGVVPVPCLGPCIHVPPPNRLILLSGQEPWPADSTASADLVHGRPSVRSRSTGIAEIGCSIHAAKIESYQ